MGGSVSLGYQFTKDLTGSFRFEGQNVKIENPEYPVPRPHGRAGPQPALHLLGDRCSTTPATTPSWPPKATCSAPARKRRSARSSIPRASVEFSQFYRIFQRADRSGNHVLNLQLRAAYSGDDTPIFERFYAGGFSTHPRLRLPRRDAPRSGLRHGRRRRFPDAGHRAVPLPDHGRRHAQGRDLLSTPARSSRRSRSGSIRSASPPASACGFRSR